MNSLQRFLETMHYGKPDRVPYFEEGIQKKVMSVWKNQGYNGKTTLNKFFKYDPRVELEPNLEPRPYFSKWPSSIAQLQKLRESLDPSDHHRYPSNWKKILKSWQRRDYVLMLRVHRGFFLSLGVDDWKRLHQVLLLTKDHPDLIIKSMEIQAEFICRLIENLLGIIQIDAVIFSEPIGGNHGPLISPRMYKSLILSGYKQVIDQLRKFGIDLFIIRTYANLDVLLPGLIEVGFNCLWACEFPPGSMDYLKFRKEYGKELRLIGGIDLDVLRSGKEAIRREIEEKIPDLLQDGGYIPLADGRIREDIPFENYMYYRQLLMKITTVV